MWPQLAGIDVDRPAGSAPIGSLDVASVVDGGVRVAGWVLDPEFDLPITVRVSVTNPGQGTVTSGAIIARGTRTDVPSNVQYADPMHGFDMVVPTATAPGAHGVRHRHRLRCSSVAGHHRLTPPSLR